MMEESRPAPHAYLQHGATVPESRPPKLSTPPFRSVQSAHAPPEDVGDHVAEIDEPPRPQNISSSTALPCPRSSWSSSRSRCTAPAIETSTILIKIHREKHYSQRNDARYTYT